MNLEGNEAVLVTANNYITEDVRSNLGAQMFPEGSVVFPKVGGAIVTNKKRRIARPSCVDNNVMGLVPDVTIVDCDYLHYWMLGQDIYEFSNKANPPSITQATVKAWPFLLPPLEEQRRIIAILDQAFVALDRARALAEANRVDAIELMSRGVEYELSSDAAGKPERIGQHADLLIGFAFKSTGYSEALRDIRIVRGDNIVQGKFRWDGVKRWPIEDRKMYEKYELALDDVLIAMDRTWVSAGIKYAIVDETALPSLLVQRVARLRSKRSIIPKYLGYWIGSSMFEKYVLSMQTGMGVPHVSGSQIENFMIKVPPIEKQVTIVERIDGFIERSRTLISVYERSLADLDNLRQSLLQKAFSGQLT